MPVIGDQTPLKVFMAVEGETGGKTGISSATIHYHKPGGSVTSVASPAWTQLSATNMPGWYTFTPPAGMVDTAGQVAFEVIATDAENFHGLVEIVAAGGGGGASAEDVWSYAARGLTEPVGLAAGELAGVSTLTAQQVWEHVERTLTSVGSSGATAQEVWEYATRALTDKSGFSGTATNMRGTDNALLAANYVAPTNLTAAQVWAHVTRTLTGSPITPQQVWEYATRSLTDKAGFDATAVAGISNLSSAMPSAASVELIRKILANRTVDRGNKVELYNDNNTLLGTWTWNEATKTRGKLS